MQLYAKSGRLGEFRVLAVEGTGSVGEDRALSCLNHLVADALTLAPSCLQYLASLKNDDVFRFCAIPQVSARSNASVAAVVELPLLIE